MRETINQAMNDPRIPIRKLESIGPLNPAVANNATA
jgi:hypothetical protein